jgi:hypothetical protein
VCDYSCNISNIEQRFLMKRLKDEMFADDRCQMIHLASVVCKHFIFQSFHQKPLFYVRNIAGIICTKDLQVQYIDKGSVTIFVSFGISIDESCTVSVQMPRGF